ncbi:MAG: ABC transporter substrate-binding protein, partial [Pseudomonadota bacterium]
MMYKYFIILLSFFSAGLFACEQAAKNASRIAVAGGSITEIIYFLGEEHRIVAIDRTSNFPEAAKKFPSVGYVRNLSAEGLVSLKPSLILGEHDMGPLEVLELVKKTGVETITVAEEFNA